VRRREVEKGGGGEPGNEAGRPKADGAGGDRIKPRGVTRRYFGGSFDSASLSLLRMTAMNKAVGIIPARWSSTRFPGKPLHLIAGKALLRRVCERCDKAKNLDSVIVATDDTRIAEAALNWGAEVALTSKKHCSGTDRVAEVARKAKEFALIVNIQGDEPLIEPRLIDRIVE